MKALIAERAIFFVLLPFFRFCGNAGLEKQPNQLAATNKSMLLAVASLLGSWALVSVALLIYSGKQL